MNGPAYADEIAERSRRMTVELALKDIARRLTAADRPTESLAMLDAAEHGERHRAWLATD